MCLSLGHTPPQAIIDAITNQLKTLPFAYNGVSSAPVRAKLCKLLADVIPGNRLVVLQVMYAEIRGDMQVSVHKL